MRNKSKIKRNFFSLEYLSDDWWLKSAVKWLIFIFFAFTLQSQISAFGYPLNFIILIVYAFVLHIVKKPTKKEESPAGEWEIKGTVFGASIGILDDIISGSIVGPSCLSKGLVGFFGAVLFGNVFFKWTAMLGIIVIFFLTVFDGLMQIILRIIFSEIRISIYYAIHMILLQALINIPFGILLKPADNK